jgi:hypothetical protein
MSGAEDHESSNTSADRRMHRPDTGKSQSPNPGTAIPEWLERAIGWDTFLQVVIIVVGVIIGVVMVIARAFE